MSGKALKAKAGNLAVSPKSHHACIQKLIVEGVFDSPISSPDVARNVRENSGRRLKGNHVQTYMKKFLTAGVVRAVKPHGSKHNFWVLASVARSEALKQIGKTQKVREIEEELFSTGLLVKLKRDFGRELDELHDNFGKNGNATAFLLRKILEKLIIKAFLKQQKGNLLEDKGRPGGWRGLKDMIEIAAQEKHQGVPFLLRHTANEIRGIKFLGDTAAHNPMVSVDITSILPQMPFIITAYEELAQRL